MAEKHWVSEENLQAYHTKVVGSKTDKTADPNGTIYQRLNALNKTIGHLLILKITFSEEFKGKTYTVTGNGETFTGTVPNSLYINLYVHGLDTIYTVSAEYEGETYTSEVETKDFYGVYFGELTAWQATLTVTVTDKGGGVGVAGAKVTAASADKTYGPVATDAEGKVTIKIGKAGTYTVKAVNAEGEETNPKPVEITTAGYPYTVSCTYFAASIVVTADISYAPNTTDNVLTLEDSAGNKQTQAISANGDYTFYVYESGAYSVYYTNGLAKSNTVSINATESTVYTATVSITKIRAYATPSNASVVNIVNGESSTITCSGALGERNFKIGGLINIRTYKLEVKLTAINKCTNLSNVYVSGDTIVDTVNLYNGQEYDITIYSA